MLATAPTLAPETPAATRQQEFVHVKQMCRETNVWSAKLDFLIWPCTIQMVVSHVSVMDMAEAVIPLKGLWLKREYTTCVVVSVCGTKRVYNV